jgi:isopenicillin-N N-acyltransferase-like protein
MAELRGIAKGCGVAYSEILALNCRSELMFVAGGGAMEPATECTSFAVLPSAAADGHVLGGQNWDWNPMLSGSVIICQGRPDGEPEYVTVGEAGHLAKVGFNAAGLGVCTNTLVSFLDEQIVGLPYHVILRELLRRETLEDAVAYLRGTPRAMSANYLLMHRDGTGQNIETVGGRGQELDITGAEKGLLCHTNHFLCKTLAPLDARVESSPHTRTRLSAMREALVKAAPLVELDDLQRALSDHAGFPNSVCSHPNEADPPDQRRATLASVVADLTTRTVWIAVGRPCQSRYGGYRLGQCDEDELPVPLTLSEESPHGARRV